MKISNANYPILKMLYRNKYDLNNHNIVYPLDVDTMKAAKFVESWELSNKEFKENIFVTSKSFIEASNKANDKLHKLANDFVINGCQNLPINGTYITDTHTVYMISNKIINNEIILTLFYSFTRLGQPITKVEWIHDLKTKTNLPGIVWITKVFDKIYNLTTHAQRTEKYKDIATSSLHSCVKIALFKRYADVELKIVKGMSKKKEVYKTYINDTDLKITYLDSKWFTTLVKSDGFKVSGHFRLQPYKLDGKWDLKLIYINEFQKSGYTAPARKLIQSHC